MSRPFRNMTPAQLRLTVAAAVLVTRLDHMTSEAFFAREADAEEQALRAAYTEADGQARNAPAGSEGDALRRLHDAVEVLLVALRTVTPDAYAAGSTGPDLQRVAVALMGFGVPVTTRPGAFGL